MERLPHYLLLIGEAVRARRVIVCKAADLDISNSQLTRDASFLRSFGLPVTTWRGTLYRYCAPFNVRETIMRAPGVGGCVKPCVSEDDFYYYTRALLMLPKTTWFRHTKTACVS